MPPLTCTANTSGTFGSLTQSGTSYFSSPMPYNNRWWIDGPLTKEEPMKTEIQDVVSKRRAKRIEKIVDEVETFMESVPRDDGMTMGWRVTFADKPETKYHYLAVQANGRWYVTNRPGSMTRDQLVELLTEHKLNGAVDGPRWAPMGF